MERRSRIRKLKRCRVVIVPCLPLLIVVVVVLVVVAATVEGGGGGGGGRFHGMTAVPLMDASWASRQEAMDLLWSILCRASLSSPSSPSGSSLSCCSSKPEKKAALSFLALSPSSVSLAEKNNDDDDDKESTATLEATNARRATSLLLHLVGGGNHTVYSNLHPEHQQQHQHRNRRCGYGRQHLDKRPTTTKASTKRSFPVAFLSTTSTTRSRFRIRSFLRFGRFRQGGIQQRDCTPAATNTTTTASTVEDVLATTESAHEAIPPPRQQESVHLQLISSRFVDKKEKTTTREEEDSDGKEQEKQEAESTRVRTATLFVHDATGGTTLLPTPLVKNDKGDDDDESCWKQQTDQILHLLESSPSNKSLLFGLELSSGRFDAWVEYVTGATNPKKKAAAGWQKYTVVLENGKLRQLLRNLWKERRLVTGRTEMLAQYSSDSAVEEEQTSPQPQDSTKTRTPPPKQAQGSRRGGFRDLLTAHTDRLIWIVQDERQEAAAVAVAKAAATNDEENLHRHRHPSSTYLSSLDPSKSLFGWRRWIRGGGGGGGGGAANATASSPLPPTATSLLSWLEQSYGSKETLELMSTHLQKRTEEEQLQVMQKFLDWFRSQYPYYYDKCDACGASYKADGGAAPVANAEEEKESEEAADPQQDEDEEDDDDGGGTFLGYVYPSESELRGRAGRTELYKCHVCGTYTRFPRYNAVSFILESHRGRCGEYGMLLFRILRALGHEARWVADWADHVWAEFRLGKGRWVHLDPCEAAVDQPLLYQEWGKTQTYIVAFGAPLAVEEESLSLSHDERQHSDNDDDKEETFWIQDVTSHYTSDSMSDIWSRREEDKEEVASSIRAMEEKVKETLEPRRRLRVEEEGTTAVSNATATRRTSTVA